MIFILGMHRSGTSAIAGLVAAMGAYAGAPEEMLAPSPDNPKGFFERKDVLAANRLIMQHHHSNWHDTGRYDTQTAPLPQALEDRLARITAHMQAHAPCMLKDPRFCFTLPYWLKHSAAPILLLAIRHPAAIAQSLHTRNQMPLEQALALWENYMTRALHHTANLPLIPVRYETLVATPAQVAHTLHSQLTAYFPILTLPSALPIHPELAHATEADLPLSPSQQRLWERINLNATKAKK